MLKDSRTVTFELLLQEHLLSELKHLQISNMVSNQSKLLQLHPNLETFLTKIVGHLKHANITNQSKHHTTTLIIQYYYRTLYHSGRDQTLFNTSANNKTSYFNYKP